MRCFSVIIRQNSGIIISLLFGLIFGYLITRYSNSGCFPLPISLSNFEELTYSKDLEVVLDSNAGAQKVQKIVRPRYYSTELGIREKLFVGVLTTEKTIRSLAVAINKTCSHLVNKMMFFIDAKSAEKANVITLKLPGIVGFVDSEDVLKPFHMLKYLTDNFLEEYDYFFLTKDSTYINGRLLMESVNKISVSHDVHIGGMKSSNESLFCTLDGGVLLSNSVLRKIQSNLDWCVQNAVSEKDDRNMGRCIYFATKIPCQQSLQDVNLRSVILPNKEISEKTLKVKKAVTFFPIRTAEGFYFLHLKLSREKLLETKKEIAELKKKVDVKTNGLAWPAGSYPPKAPETRFDVLRWDYFNATTLFLPTSFQNTKPLIGAELQDIQNVVNASVQWLRAKYNNGMVFKELINGYRRFDPSRGLDYILDLSFRDKTGKEIFKRVEGSKPLGRVEIVPVPYVTESSRVHIVLPVHLETRQATLTFMHSYSQACMKAPSENTYLLLVLLYAPNVPGKGHAGDVFKEVKELAQALSSTHHREAKIAWVSIKVGQVGGKGAPLDDDLLYFAMVDLAINKLPNNCLILLAQPNMEIRHEYFNRVRMNTILGTQVYSPIPFTEYDPEIVYSTGHVMKKPELEIHKNTGRFDTYNTRHLSFYSSDYTKARAKLSAELPLVKVDKDILKLITTHQAFGSEVESLLGMFVHEGKLNVLRGTEPGLRLRHTSPRCDSGWRTSAQRQRCKSQAVANTATRAQLANYLLNTLEVL